MLAAGRTIRPTERVGTKGAREEARRAAIERESATHVREARARFLVDSIAIPLFCAPPLQRATTLHPKGPSLSAISPFQL